MSLIAEPSSSPIITETSSPEAPKLVLNQIAFPLEETLGAVKPLVINVLPTIPVPDSTMLNQFVGKFPVL